MITDSVLEATPSKAASTASSDVAGEGISREEFKQRIVTVRNALDKAGLVGLVGFGDCRFEIREDHVAVQESFDHRHGLRFCGPKIRPDHRLPRQGDRYRI